MKQDQIELKDLLALLKSQGVKSFKNGPLDLEFFPPALEDTKEEDLRALSQGETISCPCGHPESAHMPDGCLTCAGSERCAKKTS